MPDVVRPAPGRIAGRLRSARSLSVLGLLCCAGVYAGGFSDGGVGALVTIVAGAVWFGSYFMLRAEIDEAADLPEDRLDEREVALRDRSYLIAYQLLGGAVAVSLILGIVDDAVGDLVTSWVNIWAALLFLAAFLPSAVVAHSRPRPESEAE